MNAIQSAGFLDLNGASFLQGTVVGVSLDDPSSMLEVLLGSVKSFSGFKGASESNVQAYTASENDGVVQASFEVSREVSMHYVIGMRFEWVVDQEGKSTISCLVSTNRMLDNRGIFSNKWRIEGDMEESFVLSEEQTVAEFLTQVFDQAVSFHAKLLEQAGVCRATLRELGLNAMGSEDVARAMWFLK